MLFKNVASQGLYIMAYDKTTGVAKTGDAANITATISKDGAASVGTATTNPTEISGGVYWYPLSQAETNANEISLIPSSVTANILINPIIVCTTGSFNYANLDAAITTRTKPADTQAAVTNLTNAPTAGDFTAAMKTSLNSATPTVTAGTVSDKTGYALTAGEHTNIASDTQTGLTTQGYNATRAGYLDTLNGLVTSIWGAATRTLSAFGFGVTVSTNSDKTGYALTAGEHTNVVADVNTALDATGTELSAIPSATGSLRQKIVAQFQYLIFKRSTTATTETLYKADGTTSLGTAAVSDDGTTATHNKVS